VEKPEEWEILNNFLLLQSLEICKKTTRVNILNTATKPVLKR